VATALQRLKALGILNWVRRCAESWRDGRFVLEQETNAYGLLEESQWRGYRAPAFSALAGGSGGNPPCPLRSPRLEGDLAGKVARALARDPKDGAGGRPGRLGRAFMARDS
jgi:hypothetical protein